jgi:hypothetical protein
MESWYMSQALPLLLHLMLLCAVGVVFVVMARRLRTVPAAGPATGPEAGPAAKTGTSP